jgi:hypothetical protein
MFKISHLKCKNQKKENQKMIESRLYKAGISIMRSYDYSHFEVSLSTDEDMTLQEIDDMRKDAIRLVDKAVKQYQIARDREKKINNGQSYDYMELERKAKIIMENYPQSEWTPEQIATIKELTDFDYALGHGYDYEEE